MEWLNIHAATLRAPEYIGSEPVARATWLNVSSYCAGQENGGRIEGAARWKDRQWQQTCGVTLAEIHASGDLLSFDGDDLIVWGYPLDTEEKLRRNRQHAAAGGRAKAANRRTDDVSTEIPSTATSGASSTSTSTSIAGASTEGKGREGNERKDTLQCVRATPTLAEVVAYGSTQGNATPEICEAWWNDHEARPISPQGNYTDKSGCEVADWRPALRGYAVRWRSREAEQKQRYAHSARPPAQSPRAAGQIQRPHTPAAPSESGAIIRGGRRDDATGGIPAEKPDSGGNET